MALALRLILPLALLSACGDEESETTPTGAGGGPQGCAAGDQVVDGSCLAPGVPPDACGTGFVHDGDHGCAPVLPAEACAEGLMAVPGDSECRRPAVCESGTWGGIPVASDTEHVDASYTGGASDGSASAPWTRIQDAIDAALPGAIVAIAAGSYVEDLLVESKPVVLWAACPELVDLTSTGGALAAVFIRSASGSEIRRLSISGPAIAVLISGSEDVVVEQAWIHDNGGRGINVQDDLGPTSVTVTRSLLERNGDLGVHVSGSDVIVDATVVRDTLSTPAGISGRGINIQDNPATGARPTVWVKGSVLERNHDVGLFAGASDVTIETTVIRDTQLNPQTLSASGVEVVESPTDGLGSSLVVKQCLFERSRSHELFVQGSEVNVEATVLRDTALDGQGRFGRPVQLQGGPETGTPATGRLRTSLIESGFEALVAVVGAASASLEGCLLRDAVPRDGLLGDGLVVVSYNGPARADVTASRIERSARAAVSGFGANIGLENSGLVCQTFDLATEAWNGQPSVFEDLGEVLCGCPQANESCHAQSHGLEPPPPP